MSKIGRIAAEIKQDKGFSSIQQEALLTLLRTGDWVRHVFAQHFAQHGDLTHQQYNVLRILRGAGPRGLPTLQIAERMLEHTPGITRLIDRLIKKDLVLRIPCPEDRRQVLCSISQAGLAALARIDHDIDKLDHDILSKLDEKSIKQLIHLLDRIRS